MESRFYPGVAADVTKLLAELRALLDEDSAFEVQTMMVSSTAVLQARKSSTLRDLTGLSAALTVKVTPEHGGTRVEVGMQKWLDKAAVAAVAYFVLPVLLALPALGAYWQHKLTEDVWKVVEGYIARKAGGYVPPLPGSCGNCGTATVSGSAFCSKCGSDLRARATCQSCGAAQHDPSARFCNRCGKPVGS